MVEDSENAYFKSLLDLVPASFHFDDDTKEEIRNAGYYSSQSFPVFLSVCASLSPKLLFISFSSTLSFYLSLSFSLCASLSPTLFLSLSLQLSFHLSLSFSLYVSLSNPLSISFSSTLFLLDSIMSKTN